MMGLESLSHWIHDHHLCPENYSLYSKMFPGHPARFVVLKNFLQESVAEPLSRFLKTEATFQTVYGLYTKGSSETNEEDWLKAATPQGTSGG